MKDNEARHKLRRSLLSIHDRFPEGFTSLDLAQDADVVHETARDILKPEYSYVAIVGKTAVTRGRPGNLYVVSSSGMHRLLTDAYRIDPELVWNALSKPVSDLEMMIEDLSRRKGSALERRLEMVTIDLRGCDAHTEHLRVEWPGIARRFEAAVEQQRVRLNLFAVGRKAVSESIDLSAVLDDGTTVADARSIIVPVLASLEASNAWDVFTTLSGKTIRLLTRTGDHDIRLWLELIREVSEIVCDAYPQFESGYFEIRKLLNERMQPASSEDEALSVQTTVSKEDKIDKTAQPQMAKRPARELDRQPSPNQRVINALFAKSDPPSSSKKSTPARQPAGRAIRREPRPKSLANHPNILFMKETHEHRI